MYELLLEPPTRLETERLTLRAYRPGDGAWSHTMSQRHREHLQRDESGNAAMFICNAEEAEVTVRKFAVDWAARDAFFLGALARTGGAFVALKCTSASRTGASAAFVGYLM